MIKITRLAFPTWSILQKNRNTGLQPQRRHFTDGHDSKKEYNVILEYPSDRLQFLSTVPSSSSSRSFDTHPQTSKHYLSYRSSDKKDSDDDSVLEAKYRRPRPPQISLSGHPTASAIKRSQFGLGRPTNPSTELFLACAQSLDEGQEGNTSVSLGLSTEKEVHLLRLSSIGVATL